jgi:hypothetical protein
MLSGRSREGVAVGTVGHGELGVESVKGVVCETSFGADLAAGLHEAGYAAAFVLVTMQVGELERTKAKILLRCSAGIFLSGGVVVLCSKARS